MDNVDGVTETYNPFRRVNFKFSIIVNSVVPMVGDKIGNGPIKSGERLEVRFPDGHVGEYTVHVVPEYFGVRATKARIAEEVHGTHVQIDLIGSDLEVRYVPKDGDGS